MSRSLGPNGRLDRQRRTIPALSPAPARQPHRRPRPPPALGPELKRTYRSLLAVLAKGSPTHGITLPLVRRRQPVTTLGQDPARQPDQRRRPLPAPGRAPARQPHRRRQFRPRVLENRSPILVSGHLGKTGRHRPRTVVPR